MIPVGREVHVRVPATSANLGPGFDTLGLALALYDELTVRIVDGPTTVSVTGVGEGVVPTDASNLVASSILTTLERFGETAPGLALTAVNRVPHGRGLGSSGAAIVAGVMAAAGLLDATIGRPASGDLLAAATELEGHPDNVAPALFGGLTIAWTASDGPRSKKLNVHRGVAPLVLVPEHTLSTSVARGLQPASVPHADAVFNVSRSALLVAALTQSPELLVEATQDRLHQSYRAAAMPETDALIRVLREAGHAAVVSGAGPSILVLCSDPAERFVAAELAESRATTPWQVLMPAVDYKGATVNSRPGETAHLV